MAYNHWVGTAGYRALEQSAILDAVTKRHKSMGRLGSPTNIWGIGQTLIALCNREPHPTTDYLKPKLSVRTFIFNAQNIYCEKLRDLLTRCVQYRPEDRITPSKLLEAVARHTAGTTYDDDDDDDGDDGDDGDGDDEGEEDGDKKHLALGMRKRRSTPGNERTHWESAASERYRVRFAGEREEAKIKAEKKAESDAKKQENKDKKKGKKGKK